MSPIASTTAMEIKTNRWFNAWTTPISEILEGKPNKVESTIEEGICLKVIPDVHSSFYGPYLNGVIAKNGQERVFLICLESNSDYSYATGIALKGEYIKPCKKDRTGKLFTKSFDDLLDVNARNRLEAIAAGSGNEITTADADSKENLVDEVETTADADSKENLVDEVETNAGADSKENLVDEVVAAPGIDNFADKLEVTSEEVDKKFSKRDLIAYTLVNHFLNRTNLPFFQHDK